MGGLVKENNNLSTRLKEKEAIIVSLEDHTNNVSKDGNDSSVVEEELR